MEVPELCRIENRWTNLSHFQLSNKKLILPETYSELSTNVEEEIEPFRDWHV